MSAKLRYIAIILGGLLIVSGAACLSINDWLPWLARQGLPAGTSLSVSGHINVSRHGLTLPGASLYAAGCQLAEIRNIRLNYSGALNLSLDKLTLDSTCFARWPATDNRHQQSPLTLEKLQRLLPSARLNIRQLTLSPWQTWQGSLKLTSHQRQQHLTFSGDKFNADLRLNKQHLTVSQVEINSPLFGKQPLSLSGTLDLSDQLSGLPDKGRLAGVFHIRQQKNPLRATLSWQREQGQLELQDQGSEQRLLSLPWRVTPDKIVITDGHWAWSAGQQTLSGQLALTARNWSGGLEETEFSGRLNALTVGRGGKGNVVLSIGPGKLGRENSRLPMRLTGTAKMADLQFYTGLPATLQGALLSPEIHFNPGALLLMRGEILPGWEVDEARWPLAGVKLGQQGANGLLQAHLKVRNHHSNFYLLHLAGQARNFLPDQGQWDWRYWGKGMILPVKGHWDIHGRGFWHDKMITLTELSTGFDQIRYGNMTLDRPRMVLEAPAKWSTLSSQPEFTGKFKINARTTHFGRFSHLPDSQLNLVVDGKTPDQFQFKGQLVAGEMGPVRVYGRRDKQRWLGRAWWAPQSLTVFQPLAGSAENLALRNGTLRAQAAFSVSPQAGFQAGGHWVVSDGEIWTPSNQFSGVAFSLPFRFADHRWRFGVRGPVSLRIARIQNQLMIEDVQIDLKGTWPCSDAHPLWLPNVNMKLLGGRVSISDLQLPQHVPAVLRLERIGLSQVVGVLHPKQLAMSGKVSGELPFWLRHRTWLVHHGWVKNDGPLTLRVDKDLIDGMIKNNLAAGVAMDLLKYMEISRTMASINVDAKGNLVMTSTVQGSSRFNQKNQRVRLNYQHQENIFSLWRSLSFGHRLESWLEENARLPVIKESVK